MNTDSKEQPEFKPCYLGDAVYASFDGYQIWLHLNSHDSPGLIALEPSVMNRLLQYARDVMGGSDDH